MEENDMSLFGDNNAELVFENETFEIDHVDETDEFGVTVEPCEFCGLRYEYCRCGEGAGNHSRPINRCLTKPKNYVQNFFANIWLFV